MNNFADKQIKIKHIIILHLNNIYFKKKLMINFFKNQFNSWGNRNFSRDNL